MGINILIIDDEQKMCSILKKVLDSEGYNVKTATDGFEALKILENCKFHIILCDLKMPNITGIEVLEKAKKIQPDVDFIIMTAYSTVETAVESMKKGAFDYLIKPFSMDELKILIKRIVETMELKEENIHLKEVLQDKFNFDNIVAKSKAMEQVLTRVKKVARSNACVLLRGESGTGKEVIAKCIHYASPRSEKTLIKVNCGAIPDTLLESELFGYTKGAFTGANETRMGLFESADKGTIFLDEIGDISPALQVKLLRVLQDGEFQRVGNYSETIKVDVRIIAATNQNLEESVKKGEFREDLYFRLNVVPIHIPSLKERSEDIEPLIQHFLRKYSISNESFSIAKEAMEVLLSYNYPGNIRELENAIEHAIVMSNDNIITVGDLPLNLQNFQRKLEPSNKLFSMENITIEDMEKHLILNALKKTKGNFTRAAKLLGITRRTLGYRIKKYDLECNISKSKEESN